MASRFQTLLNERGNHKVGNLNSHEWEQINEGAYVGDDVIDNFTMVETYYEHEDPADITSPVVRKCKQVTDVTKPQYLIATVERRVEIPGFYMEQLDDFYNAKGEQAAIYHIPVGKRIETSAFVLCSEENKEVTEIVAGMVAYFDPNEKAFVVCDLAKLPDSYTKASVKFQVAEIPDNLNTLCGQDLVRLEVIA